MPNEEMYIGERGPHTVDSSTVYSDDGQPVRGVRVTSARVDGAPVEGYDVVRLSDLKDGSVEITASKVYVGSSGLFWFESDENGCYLKRSDGAGGSVTLQTWGAPA